MSLIESTTRIPAGTWIADTDHSGVEFAVRHLGFATIKGRVLDFDVTVTGGERPRVEGTMRMGSVTTFVADRDLHLRSPDFFDADRHPESRFVGEVVELEGERVRVSGMLTLRGVTRPVELHGTYTAPIVDGWGAERIGLELETEIDRREWGVSWNEVVPGGGLLVANHVRVNVTVSAVRE